VRLDSIGASPCSGNPALAHTQVWASRGHLWARRRSTGNPPHSSSPQGAPQRGNATAPIAPPRGRREEVRRRGRSTTIRRTDLGGPPTATADDLPHHAHTRVWAGKCQVRAPLGPRPWHPQRQGRVRATGVSPWQAAAPGQELRQIPGDWIAQAVRAYVPPPGPRRRRALDARHPAGRADRAGPRRLSALTPATSRTRSTTESRTCPYTGMGK
jgi:hypothetical protein